MTRLHGFRSGIVCVGALLVLAACGGGGGSSPTTSNNTAPPPPPTTGSVTLNWTIPTENTDGSQLTNLSGFKVVYGQSATELTQSVSIDNPSVDSYQFDNLSSGTWYFAVVTVDSAGTESIPTNVVSQTI